MAPGAPRLHAREAPKKKDTKAERSVREVVSLISREAERDERTLQDYKKLLDKYSIPYDVSKADIENVLAQAGTIPKTDAKRITEILGGGTTAFNYIAVTEKGLNKKRAILRNIELTGDIPPEYQVSNDPIEEEKEPKEKNVVVLDPEKQPVREKVPLVKRKVNELDAELLQLDTETRERMMTRFIQNNTTKLMSLAAYLQEAEKEEAGTSPYHAEAIGKTVEEVYEKLEKEAQKDKLLKAQFFNSEEGKAQLRGQLNLLAREYSLFFTQIQESNLDIPETLEGKKAAFVRMLQQFKFESDVAPSEHPDEFVAQGMLQLQLQTSRPGKTPSHPKGSGMVAAAEAKGTRIGSELVLSYMETSVMAAGLALATAVFGPQWVATLGVKVSSWVVALILSYGFVLPFKNLLSREVIATGSVSKGIARGVKKHPLGALSLATVLAAAAGPAANSVLQAMNISSTNAERISTKFDEASSNLERVMSASETGEVQAVNSESAEVNIAELFGYSDSIFNDFISRELHGQIYAGLRAEEHPEDIDALRVQYPGMTFGETGRGGPGPKYHAKEALFLTGEFASDVTPGDRSIVQRARAEAGLLPGESLEDAERRFYREYNELIATPVRHEDGVTESPRERVVRIIHEIQRLQGILADQNPASSAYNLLIVGEPPVSPELIEFYEQQLQTELLLISGHFNDFRTRAVHAIDIMKTASNSIVVGSTLSLTVPEPALLDAVRPLLGIELVTENPWEAKTREWFAEHFGGTPEQYVAQASSAVSSIGYLLALLLTLSPTAAHLASFKRRGKRTREDQPYHQKSVENAEEEAVDYWYDYINKTLVPLMPGTPTYTRMRVRMALREFISKNVHDLAETHSAGDHIKDWLITELRPGQITDDTRVLQDFEKVLNKMRSEPKYVEKFYEILFPGYTKLRKALDYRTDLFTKIGRGQELTGVEMESLASQRTPEGHKSYLKAISLEAAHAGLEREIIDTKKKAEILSKILLDVKVGADTYHVFSDDAEAQSKILNDGVVSVISARQYTWTVDGSQGKESQTGLVAPNHIDSRHMEIVRRVAETTEGAKVIQTMMAQTQRHLQSLQKRYEITQLEIVRNGLQAKQFKGALKIPESILANSEEASIRDQLTKGAGLFMDVAYEVREALENIPQEGKSTETKEYAVRTQLDTMARTFFNSGQFKEFITTVNKGRLGNEQLRADLRLVYGEKTQRVEGDSEQIDVPGFSLRLRLTNQSGEEMRVNKAGEVVPATSETRSDDQDFQMSHVLLYNKTPQLSARAFMNWAERSALPALYSKATKQWLRQNFVDGDANKEAETKFTLPSKRDAAEEWLKKFYQGDTVQVANTLRYKRADRARELVTTNGRVTADDLDVFFNPDPAYGGVPLREQINQVLDIYYSKVSQKGVLGGVRSALVRTQGVTLDLNGEGYVRARGKKPMLISDYIVRKGKFPRR